MKKNILFLLFFISLRSFSAVYLKVLYIADHTVDCADKKCLLTRDAPTDAYQIFDKKIEGFTYEAGYEYCILLEIQTPGISVPAVPFDSSQIKYVLSEIKSKTKTDTTKTVVNTRLSIPDTSKWTLYKLRTKDGTRTFSVTKAFMQFDMKNNTVSGNTDCNSFTASLSIDSSFKFENIITTKMACLKLSIEPEFLVAIKSVNKYKATAKLLYLYDDKKLVALFTRKK